MTHVADLVKPYSRLCWSNSGMTLSLDFYSFCVCVSVWLSFSQSVSISVQLSMCQSSCECECCVCVPFCVSEDDSSTIDQYMSLLVFCLYVSACLCIYINVVCCFGCYMHMVVCTITFTSILTQKSSFICSAFSFSLVL